MCGGGSGHEPAHAGFVGQGMLTGTHALFTQNYSHCCIGAVCGNIFASPNASQVRRGINLIHNNKGCVCTILSMNKSAELPRQNCHHSKVYQRTYFVCWGI